MTLPSDNHQANNDTKVDGPTHPEYEMLGHFQPRDAERILKRLEEQHLSFEVNDCRQIRLFTVWPFYRSCQCIYVRREHKEKAEAISDEDSVRSRAAAGFRYAAIGGVVCTVFCCRCDMAFVRFLIAAANHFRSSLWPGLLASLFLWA